MMHNYCVIRYTFIAIRKKHNLPYIFFSGSLSIQSTTSWKYRNKRMQIKNSVDIKTRWRDSEFLLQFTWHNQSTMYTYKLNIFVDSKNVSIFITIVEEKKKRKRNLEIQHTFKSVLYSLQCDECLPTFSVQSVTPFKIYIQESIQLHCTCNAAHFYIT